jgi:hypothetical protein
MHLAKSEILLDYSSMCTADSSAFMISHFQGMVFKTSSYEMTSLCKIHGVKYPLIAVLYLFEEVFLQPVLVVEMCSFYEHSIKERIILSLFEFQKQMSLIALLSISRHFTWKILKVIT